MLILKKGFYSGKMPGGKTARWNSDFCIMVAAMAVSLLLHILVPLTVSPATGNMAADAAPGGSRMVLLGDSEKNKNGLSAADFEHWLDLYNPEYGYSGNDLPERLGDKLPDPNPEPYAPEVQILPGRIGVRPSGSTFFTENVRKSSVAPAQTVFINGVKTVFDAAVPVPDGSVKPAHPAVVSVSDEQFGRRVRLLESCGEADFDRSALAVAATTESPAGEWVFYWN